MSGRRGRSAATFAVAIAVLTAGLITPAGAIVQQSGLKDSASFTKTEMITRQNLVTVGSQTQEQTVDSRNVTLTVSQTANLHGRQEVSVSWSGAHPTGGIVADPNSIDAQQEEYPVVILECRGVDAAASPADQLSPSTCWTQSWNERYQDTFQTTFPPYRLDQFATTADRTQTAGAPSSLPSTCAFLPAPTQHWVPFAAANGTVYAGGPAGCAGQPPEADNVGHSALPSNETFGVTGLDGTGSANFDVWTSAENASLGCSTTVPCSLVAIPIMGVSCDSTWSTVPPTSQPSSAQKSQDVSACQANGNFAPGQLVTPQGGESLAVSGSLWWTASNWRNRISVPLSFTVPASACNVVNNSNALDLFGSELMIQATGQWAPSFCLNSALFPVVHVQTGEPEARNLIVAGTASAALTSEAQPGGYGKPVVNAPVGVTGFAISYVIDGADGRPYSSLRLTPRLLAKLLTESYPADLFVKQEDPALSHNPLNITLDPEFIALNPGVKQGVAASEAASELVGLSSDSDVIEALTAYINADPTARAWLNGSPDEWGMVVNPSYKGIVLPVNSWPLSSTFEPSAFYASDNNDCLTHSPIPFLPLISAPLPTLEAVSENLQFGIANSTTVCSQIDGTTTGEKLVALGRETVGYRFLIGITPLADTQRYLLDTASLQTVPGTFVAPTSASLAAAASLLSFDPNTGTWPIPYSGMIGTSGGLASSRRAPTDNAAYPGTMVVYAAVPTSGLGATTANEIATWLRFAVTTGQTPGLGVGELPPGYLPITAANGLGSFASYTAQAADDVQAQNGQVPGVGAGSSASSATLLPLDGTSSLADTAGLTTGQNKIFDSSMIPVLLSIEGKTLRINLGSLGGVIFAVLVVILMFASMAFGAIVIGRRRGIW